MVVGDRLRRRGPEELRAVVGVAAAERMILLVARDFAHPEEVAVFVDNAFSRAGHYGDGHDERRHAQAETDRTVGTVREVQAQSDGQPDQPLEDGVAPVRIYDL